MFFVNRPAVLRELMMRSLVSPTDGVDADDEDGDVKESVQNDENAPESSDPDKKFSQSGKNLKRSKKKKKSKKTKRVSRRSRDTSSNDDDDFVVTDSDAISNGDDKGWELQGRVQVQEEEIGRLERLISNYEQELNFLQKDVNKKNKLLDEYQTMINKLMEDFESFKTRSREGEKKAKRLAGKDILEELLGPMDNLRRAMSTTDPQSPSKNLLQGLEMVIKEMENVLANNGVEPMDAEGKAFDPNYHEAVSRREDKSVPDNTVIEVVERGYTIYDSVLRFSRVVVSTGGPPREDGSDDPEKKGKHKDEPGRAISDKGRSRGRSKKSRREVPGEMGSGERDSRGSAEGGKKGDSGGGKDIGKKGDPEGKKDSSSSNALAPKIHRSSSKKLRKKN